MRSVQVAARKIAIGLEFCWSTYVRLFQPIPCAAVGTQFHLGFATVQQIVQVCDALASGHTQQVGFGANRALEKLREHIHCALRLRQRLSEPVKCCKLAPFQVFEAGV